MAKLPTSLTQPQRVACQVPFLAIWGHSRVQAKQRGTQFQAEIQASVPSFRTQPLLPQTDEGARAGDRQGGCLDWPGR